MTANNDSGHISDIPIPTYDTYCRTSLKIRIPKIEKLTKQKKRQVIGFQLQQCITSKDKVISFRKCNFMLLLIENI